MQFDLSVPAQLARAMTPDLILMGGAMLLLLVAVWRTESPAHDRFVGVLALLLCAITAGAVVWMLLSGASAAPGLIAVDRFRWATDLLILLATSVAIALSMDENRREGIALGEGYVMVLLAASGMMVLAAARDLMMVFLGIELMSIAVYVLAGLNRRSPRAAEASLKYFLMGAFATGFLLYGMALVYGATGSTRFDGIAHALSATPLPSAMVLIGIGLLIVGFGFKVAAVPFHMWTPDVYDGAPTPYTAFMAAGVKVAAFASFMRLWSESFMVARGFWIPVFWWLAAVTMVVGNLIALQQKSVKRMLAYSSIAHAGYLLVAVTASSHDAMSAMLFYMVAYSLATMGAFAVVVAVSGRGERGQRIDDLAGLWQERPWLATAMALFMLSLLGFPLAGGMGFWGKWYLLKAAVSNAVPLTSLAVVLVLTSVVSAGYYLNVVVTMYMKPRAADAPALPATPRLTALVIGLAAAGLIYFGVQPGLLVRWARDAMDTPSTLRPPAVNVTAAAPQR